MTQYMHWLFTGYLFHSPTKLLFGLGIRKAIASEAPRFGKRALLIVDGNLASIGREISGYLEHGSVEVAVYDKIYGEPTIESVGDAAKHAVEIDPDVVIGIGGGSTLDTSKIVSALISNKMDIRDMFGVDRVPRKGRPLILLPTTAGTGSEVDRTAVVSEGHVKRSIISHNIAADIAMVDPELTVGCPPRVTAYTGLDTLTHAIEGMMSTASNPLVDALALEIVRIVDRYLRRAYYNGRDIEARFYMSFAATMGGYILSSTTMVYGHSISYTLSKYGVPHGLGTAFALPYAIKINIGVIPEKISRVAETLGIAERDPRRSSWRVVEWVQELLRDLGIPRSLKEMGIPKEDIKALAREMIETYPRPNNPRQLSIEETEKLYEEMWTGS
jgi:alcohol dehydrogenase